MIEVDNKVYTCIVMFYNMNTVIQHILIHVMQQCIILAAIYLHEYYDFNDNLIMYVGACIIEHQILKLVIIS